MNRFYLNTFAYPAYLLVFINTINGAYLKRPDDSAPSGALSSVETVALPQELLTNAESGDRRARWEVADGYAEGKYGLPQDAARLLVCAENEWWDARRYVYEGYTKGIYGFPQDLAKLNLLTYSCPPPKRLPYGGNRTYAVYMGYYSDY